MLLQALSDHIGPRISTLKYFRRQYPNPGKLYSVCLFKFALCTLWQIFFNFILGTF